MPRRLESREAVEVYATDKGQIAIKQEGYMGNDDSLVFLEPHDIPTIVKWLEDVAVDANEIREMNFAAAEAEQIQA